MSGLQWPGWQCSQGTPPGHCQPSIFLPRGIPLRKNSGPSGPIHPTCIHNGEGFVFVLPPTHPPTPPWVGTRMPGGGTESTLVVGSRFTIVGTFSLLPDTALAAVLVQLSPAHLATLACCSRKLRKLAHFEPL